MALQINQIQFDNLTNAERDALVNPPQGTTIYNVTLGELEVNDGTPGSPIWRAASNVNADWNATSGDSEILNKPDLSLKADLVGGLVPASQLPSYVDDVIEVANFASLPGTGETGKIYITLDDNKTYRWAATVYVEISDDLSASEIKTLYESNADTNAFTDADVTNLGNQSGVNTGDEVQATETVSGIAEIATTAEVTAGTDDMRIVTPKKLFDALAASGIGGIIQTINGIDGTVAGDTSVFTVPVGSQTVIRMMVVRLTAVSGAGTVPKVSLGTNASDYNNIFSNQSVSGLVLTTDDYTFVAQGLIHVGQASEVMIFKVNNASTKTTYTMSVDLLGYTI